MSESNRTHNEDPYTLEHSASYPCKTAEYVAFGYSLSRWDPADALTAILANS